MGVDLYQVTGSSQCCAVELTAAALGVELNLIPLNLRNKEQMTPEFLKINPQHTIPTLVDNGFSVWETRAIMTYLANKYGKDDKLYPKDPQARAVVDQRLYFDMGTLYKSFSEYFYPQIMSKAPADPAKLEKLHEALQFVNTFLDGNKWVAGPNLTLADIAIHATIFICSMAKVDVSKHPNIKRWYADCEKNMVGYKGIIDKQIDAIKAWLEMAK